MSSSKGIVVGLDGTPGCVDALRWVDQHRDWFGPVRPVTVWDYPLRTLYAPPIGPADLPSEAEFAQRSALLAEAAISSFEHEPFEPLAVVHSRPGAGLIEASVDADFLAVGTRGRGPLRSNILGSVGRECADETTVPLIIIPAGGEHEPVPCEAVLVGVDHSEHARRALEVALSIAPDSARVVAVSTWQTPFDPPFGNSSARFDVRVLRAQAQETVDEIADDACRKMGVDPSRVEREVTEGDPRWVLMSRSEVSDLLVLGQRGRTGLPHAFLGSTTTALIHRPRCPIMVVPG
jgi:nucleotide-binding universal stress UspA family protein